MTAIRRALLLGGVTFFLSACDGSKTAEQQPGEKPLAGQIVHIAAPAGAGFAENWQLLLEEWSNITGATYEVHEYTLPADGSSVDAALLKSADGKRPDVFVIPNTSIAELEAAGALAAIPNEALDRERLDWSDLLRGLRDRVATIAMKPRLIPVSCSPLVCAYRRDLLEQAGKEPPRTWEKYRELIETRDEWAAGRNIVEPWSPEFRATMFLARAAAVAKHDGQFSFCFRMKDGTPLVDNPGFVDALDRARADLKGMPGDVLKMQPADCLDAVIDGSAALAIVTRPVIATLRNSASASKEKRASDIEIGFCELPGVTRVYDTGQNEWIDLPPETMHRVTLTAFDGWAMGVSADSENLEAAWQLVQELAVLQSSNAFPPPHGGPCRGSQVGGGSQWEGVQLSGSEADSLTKIYAESLRSRQVVRELPIPYRHQFREALTRRLTEALASETTSAEVLKAAAADWTTILNEHGPEKLAAAYRRNQNVESANP